MRDAMRPAALTAALLNPSGASRRVDRCLVNHTADRDHDAGTDEQEAEMPLLCEKGAASVHGFDPLIQMCLGARVASAGGPARTGMQRIRVWLRIDATRRSQMKQAAAYRKQSCRAFLASAVESFMTECASIPDAAALPLATMAKAPIRRTSTSRRHKVAIAVDFGQRDQIRAMAARLGQTIQAFLMASLDKQLKRMARSDRALRLLFDAAAETSDRPSAVPPGEISDPREGVMPVAAKVISFRRLAPARKSGGSGKRPSMALPSADGVVIWDLMSNRRSAAG